MNRARWVYGVWLRERLFRLFESEADASEYARRRNGQGGASL